MKKNSIFSTIIILTICLLLISCSQTKEGVITGIQGKMNANNYDYILYTGNIIVTLPDSQKVKVECPESMLKNIKGCPNFTDEIEGGFIMEITILIEENQKALITLEQDDTWKLVDILD